MSKIEPGSFVVGSNHFFAFGDKPSAKKGSSVLVEVEARSRPWIRLSVSNILKYTKASRLLRLKPWGLRTRRGMGCKHILVVPAFMLVIQILA